jgi:hypothetical protein
MRPSLGRQVPLALFALGFFVQSSADAQVVYSQNPGLISTLFISDNNSLLSRQQAENFQLNATHNIQAVTFFGDWVGVGAPLESFTVRFFSADGGGQPSVVPFYSTTVNPIFRESVGLLDPLLTVFHYGVNLPAPVTLNADTTYFLSIVNNTPNALADWGWLGTGLGATLRFQRDGDGGAFSAFVDSNLTFALHLSPVPEPSPMMLGTGSLLAAFLLRRGLALFTAAAA